MRGHEEVRGDLWPDHGEGNHVPLRASVTGGGRFVVAWGWGSVGDAPLVGGVGFDGWKKVGFLAKAWGVVGRGRDHRTKA